MINSNGQPHRNDANNESETEVDNFDNNRMKMITKSNVIREHWYLLGKHNMQSTIIHHMFYHMLGEYPHIRPIWIFSRSLAFVDATDDWKEKLKNNFQFRHHCASIQAAITMVIENIDNMRGMQQLLEDIGSHHFFYDAYEPHFEVDETVDDAWDVYINIYTLLQLIQEGLMHALDDEKTIASGELALTKELRVGWLQLIDSIKRHVSRGIDRQRNKYLAQCVTKDEIGIVRKMWSAVRANGIDDAGHNLCGGALQAYDALIRKHRMNYPIVVDRESDAFNQFVVDAMQVLSITVDSYDEKDGFVQLPEKLQDYVQSYVMMDVCPSLVRKAFMEGLINMLTYVLGEASMTETVLQTWNKIYRVMEQSIIANIIKL